MPSKNMRHMFEFCSLLLLAAVTAGMLAAILVPCQVSVPERPASSASTEA